LLQIHPCIPGHVVHPHRVGCGALADLSRVVFHLDQSHAVVRVTTSRLQMWGERLCKSNRTPAPASSTRKLHLYSKSHPKFQDLRSLHCRVSMVAPPPEITDIRFSTAIDLRKAIMSGLNSSPPVLPTMILYDERGLQIFEKITYLEEYYLTNCEIEILKNKSDEIVKRLNLKEGGIVVELGSG